MKSKLFYRDFTMLVLGQIASLFGNTILRFALSMYVLDITGSGAIFGAILAVSVIPTILLSPVGGVLADRVSRRNIMVILDFATSILIALFTLMLGMGGGLVLIAVVMILLSIIQAFYQPSVQASIPALADEEHLMQANGIVVQVNALSGLLGPILGGMLYGFLGITPILIASCVCFFLSAVMELFLRIPFTHPEKNGGMLHQIKLDLGEALRFLIGKQPQMLKLLFVLAGLNMFLSALLTVGLPYIIRIFLGLDAQMNGFAEAALAAGSILGGCLAGLFAKRCTIRQSDRFLVAAVLFLSPLVLAVITSQTPYVSYGVILGSVFLGMASVTLFNIFAQTYAQQITPANLLGKVSSFITVISILAFPIGQALYGALFDALPGMVWVIVLLACVASLFIALLTGRILQKVPEQTTESTAA